MSIKKLTILWEEYRDTTVIKGSSVYFFFVFWFTKLISFLAHRGGTLERFAHNVVKVLPKATFVIQNNTGTFLVEAYDDSLTICSGYFESALRPWLSLPNTHDIFIDIGANRGLYSVLACTKYGYKKTYAFEPNKEMVSILQENIILNKLEGAVTVCSHALGSEVAEAHFTVDPLHKGGGRIGAANRDMDTASLVSVSTLDAELSETDIPKVSFVKIDTEGYEQAVLAGMKLTLSNMSIGSVIMIETTDYTLIESMLAPYNFRIHESNNNDHLFIKHA